MNVTHGLAFLATLAALLTFGCQRVTGQYEARMENLLKMPRYNDLTTEDKDRWIGKARRADELSVKASHTPQEKFALIEVRGMLEFEESLRR